MTAGDAVSQPVFDLAVIGGGVNGCGIARDAVGRGAKVILFEKDDLASGTSSASTKLIHGGLRYLEHYEFRLVHEALVEREVLWKIAPHIVRPLRFVLPYHPSMRPAWFLRLGLFIYDHLGGRKALPPTRTLDLTTDDVGKPLRPGLFKRGFEYSDCWVDDARLVVLNARDAADRGAVIRTRCEVDHAERIGDTWQITVTDKRQAKTETVKARALVNAGGPWVNIVSERLPATRANPHSRLVRGAHIVVPRLFDHDRAYILQNEDQRIIFAIPYEGEFTLIGTTDTDHRASLDEIHASAGEVDYLCESASAYFNRELRPRDVVWSYAGVRSLQDDGADAAQAATRDYKLELDRENGAALLTVLGGKITTYRRLAEEAIGLLAPYLPDSTSGNWTGSAPLPGGEFAFDAWTKFMQATARHYPNFDRRFFERLGHAYGTRMQYVLGNAKQPADLGKHFGANLFEAEVRYLIHNEWAQTAADIVWRRSKVGLHMTPDQITALDAWLSELDA